MKRNMRINDREWSKHMWERIKAMIAGEGYISVETDPTVPQWAKQPNKPSYTATEVGALPNTTTIPTKTSDLTNDSGFITAASVPTRTSDLTNDSGFITASDLDSKVVITFDEYDDTELALYQKLNAMKDDEVRLFYASDTPATLITGGANSGMPINGVIRCMSKPGQINFTVLAMHSDIWGTSHVYATIIVGSFALTQSYIIPTMYTLQGTPYSSST